MNTNVNNTVHVSKGLSIALSSTPGLFVLFAFSKGKEVKEETIFVIQFLWTEATVSLCIVWTEKFKLTKLIQHSCKTTTSLLVIINSAIVKPKLLVTTPLDRSNTSAVLDMSQKVGWSSCFSNQVHIQTAALETRYLLLSAFRTDALLKGLYKIKLPTNPFCSKDMGYWCLRMSLVAVLLSWFWEVRTEPDTAPLFWPRCRVLIKVSMAKSFSPFIPKSRSTLHVIIHWHCESEGSLSWACTQNTVQSYLYYKSSQAMQIIWKILSSNYLNFKASDCLPSVYHKTFFSRFSKEKNMWDSYENERKNESLEYCSGIFVVHHMNCGWGYETNKSLNVSVDGESAICY